MGLAPSVSGERGAEKQTTSPVYRGPNRAGRNCTHLASEPRAHRIAKHLQIINALSVNFLHFLPHQFSDFQPGAMSRSPLPISTVHVRRRRRTYCFRHRVQNDIHKLDCLKLNVNQLQRQITQKTVPNF